MKKRKNKGESYTLIGDEFLPNMKEYKNKEQLDGHDYWFHSSH